MSLKTSLLAMGISAVLGGVVALKVFAPEPLPPIAIPESEELSRLKKQLAEFSSQKKSVTKEYNCANGSLSKETSVDEATAAKIASEAVANYKKTEELVVLPKPRDNVMLGVNSKLQTGDSFSPTDHYWFGYKRDFQRKEDIYEISYSNRIDVFQIFK